MGGHGSVRHADGEQRGQGTSGQIDRSAKPRHEPAAGDLEAEEREVAQRRDGLGVWEPGKVGSTVRGTGSVVLRERADVTTLG
jgi:hypothetical protein